MNELQEKLNKLAHFINKDATTILEVEGLKFIQKNFQDEGFNNGTLEKWKERKTADKRGRNITRYRTNRRGKQGTLNRYGRKIKDRPILTGYNSSGNKLRHSFKARRNGKKVTFHTYKQYAKRHNEGLDGMPKRQFIGKSKTLNKNITKELDRVIKSILQ